MPKPTIAHSIRSRRERTGKTPQAFAAELKLTYQAYWHIENGTRRPSLETLRKIAAALGCGVDDLLDGVPL